MDPAPRHLTPPLPGWPLAYEREPREAELDGTQAIADALEIKDDFPLLFGGVPVRADPNAPAGSIYFVNDHHMYVFDGTSWQEITK